MKPETLEDRLLKRIDRKRGDVFLRADFEDLGGYDQVGRVLRKIVREGRLVRVGQGLYARARPSMTSGEPVPVGGLSALKEALRRVGVETLPSRLEQAYNAGKHNAGADRPRGRGDSPCAPQDRIWRFLTELRACWTRASLRGSPRISALHRALSKRTGMSSARSA